MDKHTKHLLLFYGALLLASVTAFCIMFVLPMIESGRSPPQRYAQAKQQIFSHSDELCENRAENRRFRPKSLDFYALKW